MYIYAVVDTWSCHTRAGHIRRILGAVPATCITAQTNSWQDVLGTKYLVQTLHDT